MCVRVCVWWRRGVAGCSISQLQYQPAAVQARPSPRAHAHLSHRRKAGPLQLLGNAADRPAGAAQHQRGGGGGGHGGGASAARQRIHRLFKVEGGSQASRLGAAQGKAVVWGVIGSRVRRCAKHRPPGKAALQRQLRRRQHQQAVPRHRHQRRQHQHQRQGSCGGSRGEQGQRADQAPRQLGLPKGQAQEVQQHLRYMQAVQQLGYQATQH